MARQLKLLEPKLLEPQDGPPPEWQLDEPTKEVGRRGVAAVRETLQKARREALQNRHHDAA